MINEGVLEDKVLRTIALGIARNQIGAMKPIEDVLPALGVSERDYEELRLNATFIRYVEAYVTELTEQGFSFAAKSRILAEDLLPDAYSMARDSTIPSSVRAKMIENLVEWGDLKPKNTQNQVLPGAGFSIVINFGSEQKKLGNSEKVVENDEKPAIEGRFTAVLPPLEPKKQSEKVPEKEVKITDREAVKSKVANIFDEPEDYSYAGEDIIL